MEPVQLTSPMGSATETQPITPLYGSNMNYTLPQGYPPITPGKDKNIILISIIVSIISIIALIGIISSLSINGLKTAKEQLKITQNQQLTSDNKYNNTFNDTLTGISHVNTSEINFYYPSSFEKDTTTSLALFYKDPLTGSNIAYNFDTQSANFLNELKCNQLGQEVASSQGAQLEVKSELITSNTVNTCTFTIKKTSANGSAYIKQKYLQRIKNINTNLYLVQIAYPYSATSSELSDLNQSFNLFSLK